MSLLIFFALPVATIILSIVLQKILKSPILVAATFFAIFLIIAFAVFDGDSLFLVATLIYTGIAFITAYLTCLFKIIGRRLGLDRDQHTDNESCRCNHQNNETNLLSINSCCENQNDNGRLLTIRSCCNGNNNDLLTVNTNCSNNENRTDNSNCCNNDNDNEDNINVTNNNAIPVDIRANIFPNNSNCGRTGNFRGCFRRI